MSSHTVFQFSPPNATQSSARSGAKRAIQPSPERTRLTSMTIILPKHIASTTDIGSLFKQRHGNQSQLALDAQFDINLDLPWNNLHKVVKSSKRVKLSTLRIVDGEIEGPTREGLRELLKLFPTTFAAEVFSPFVVIRVRTLPPRPWPFTVGGLPLRLTTEEHYLGYDLGKSGRGPKVLQHIRLQTDDFTEEVVRQAATLLRSLKVKVYHFAYFRPYWRITVEDGTDLKVLPCTIASHVAFYQFASNDAVQDPSALRAKVPEGVEFDNTSYLTLPDAILRPGIMLGSSLRTVTQGEEIEEQYRKTSSGVLVVNKQGDVFVTVASHGFEDDGLVYHPDPCSGTVIGRIVASLPDLDISLVKLNDGLRYTNETFGNRENEGTTINGIRSVAPKNLRLGDSLHMDNPFSGSCEGEVVAWGGTLPSEGNKLYVRHHWYVFENGSEPIDGSAGSPILDLEGRLAAFFTYKKTNNADMCWGVAAEELREEGYELCGGVRTF